MYIYFLPCTMRVLPTSYRLIFLVVVCIPINFFKPSMIGYQDQT
jgi:hypothetical protein